MDHLRTISKPKYQPIQVPCLGLVPYDGLDFDTYPTRRGWNIDLLFAGDYSEHPDAEASEMLQDWLYFGTLQDILKQDEIKDRYTSWDPVGQANVVTTSHLKQDFHNHLTGIHERAIKDKEGMGLAMDAVWHIEMRLSVLSTFCNMNSTTNAAVMSERSRWPLSAEIDLSLRVLGEYIASYTYLYLHQLTWHVGGLTRTPLFPFRGSQLAQTRMLESGWCPSDVTMLSEQMSASSLLYASCLYRQESGQSHLKCSEYICLASQINESTYRSKHVIPTCQYDHMGPEIEEIISIIKDNGIPLVRISTGTKNGEPKVSVERAERNIDYIAISHVWSDGLGNSTSNTLPTCQLRRILEMITEISREDGRLLGSLNKGHFRSFWSQFKGQSMPVWLDTLCIPVRDEHREYHRHAITMMKQTYERASQVLVLEAELEKSSSTPKEEAFLRISVSKWLRRLWTLQEGVLGKRLRFKFSDAILDLQRASNQVPNPIEEPFYSPSADVLSSYWKMRSFRAKIAEPPEHKMIGTVKTITPVDPGAAEVETRCAAIIEAFAASRYRLSTRAEDDYLCLASLLDWDTAWLSGISVSHRMRKLLEQQSILPQGLIFVAGPRMEDIGWRWEVRKFGNSAVRPLAAEIKDITPVKPTERGFVVNYPGLILHMPPSALRDSVFVVGAKSMDGNTIFFKIARHQDQSNKSTDMQLDPVLNDHSRAPSESLSTCIMYYDSTKHNYTDIPMAAAICRFPTSTVCKAGEPLECQSGELATLEIVTGPKVRPKPIAEEAVWTNMSWCVR